MNFCVQGVGTTIKTDKLESDEHEVKNLLQQLTEADDRAHVWSTRKSGFMTDYFVKTPVSVFVEFPICIEISRIVIKPKVGSQCSTAFMLQTETTNRRWKSGEPVTGVKHIVAKEYLQADAVPDILVFNNPRYEARKPFALLTAAAVTGNKQEYSLRHPLPYATSGVYRLEVIILRTAGSSVAALGGLEVWGQPCRRCSKEAAEKMLVRYLRLTRKPYLKAFMPANATKTSPTDANEKTDQTDPLHATAKRRMRNTDALDIEIPDEFIDPITTVIMCMPIRLPCGIAVDAATLEKYYMEEQKWGRPPNDPFTGKPYTDSNKPVGDGALKTRIDHFITQNAALEPMKKLPRTIGSTSIASRNTSAATAKPSSLVSRPASAAATSKIKEVPTSHNTPARRHPAQSASGNPSTSESLLQQELAKMFGGSSSYLPISTEPKNLQCNDKDKCTECKKATGNSVSYRPSGNCPHVRICRDCLTNLDKTSVRKCSVCDCEWTRSSVERIHF